MSHINNNHNNNNDVDDDDDDGQLFIFWFVHIFLSHATVEHWLSIHDSENFSEYIFKEWSCKFPKVGLIKTFQNGNFLAFGFQSATKKKRLGFSFLLKLDYLVS